MRFASTILAILAIAHAAVAQYDAIHPDHSMHYGKSSKTCTEQVFANSDRFSTCLRMPLMVSAVTNGPQFIERTIQYLNAACDERTPKCSEAELAEGMRSMRDSCAEDIAKGAGSVSGLLLAIIESYPIFKRSLCSRSVSNSFCLPEVMMAFQNGIGQNLTNKMVQAALNGNTTYLAQAEAVLESGALCTGCVSVLLHVWSNIATTTDLPDARPRVQAKCGAGFGMESLPDGVLDPAIPTEEVTTSTVKGSKASQAPSVLVIDNVDNGGHGLFISSQLWASSLLVVGLAIIL